MLDRPPKEKGVYALPRRRVLVNVGQAIEREGCLRPTQKEGAGKVVSTSFSVFSALVARNKNYFDICTPPPPPPN